MATESEAQKREYQRWCRLAIQLVGAADSGRFEHLTIAAVMRELALNAVFDLLVRELPASVWEISKLTEDDRSKLSQHWRMMAQAYEPSQFHVSHNGLALLANYVLHLIDVGHATMPS